MEISFCLTVDTRGAEEDLIGTGSARTIKNLKPRRICYVKKLHEYDT